jgi:hypothetical protein
VRPLVLLLAAALLAGCLHAEADADVKENERSLADLPVPPGARRLEVRSAPYYEEEGGPPKGHTTTAVYEAPRGAGATEIVDFYAERLRGWRCRREDVGALLLHCTRGSALVSVNTENMGARPPRFEVVVDHEGNRAT